MWSHYADCGRGCSRRFTTIMVRGPRSVLAALSRAPSWVFIVLEAIRTLPAAPAPGQLAFWLRWIADRIERDGQVPERAAREKENKEDELPDSLEGGRDSSIARRGPRSRSAPGARRRTLEPGSPAGLSSSSSDSGNGRGWRRSATYPQGEEAAPSQGVQGQGRQAQRARGRDGRPMRARSPGRNRPQYSGSPPWRSGAGRGFNG